MEEMEAEMLKKLQNTQQRHKETFLMLESAMKEQKVSTKSRLAQSLDSRDELLAQNKTFTGSAISGLKSKANQRVL